jgi:hypothetical protein
MRRSAICLVLLLCGCVPSLPVLTSEHICKLSHTLRDTIHDANGSKDAAVVRAELIRRGATSQSEWDLTDAGKIQTGMHKCIVFALFGAPAITSMSGPVNVYQFPSGDVVTFQGGVVTAFTVVSPH